MVGSICIRKAEPLSAKINLTAAHSGADTRWDGGDISPQ